MRESRTYGSVRAKAEWLSYSTNHTDKEWIAKMFANLAAHGMTRPPP
jgi:hypothetical protein